MDKVIRIIEAGHYYSAYGPTIWSTTGVEILNKVRQPSDKTMLFVDDFHPLANVSHFEKSEDVVELLFDPDILVFESKMVDKAKEILEKLLNLEQKKKRAHLNQKDGKYYISGFPITNSSGIPLCVLLDAALTVYKYELGYKNIINILPSYYGTEQEHLIKILGKLNLKDLNFSIILFEKDGSFHQVDHYPPQSHVHHESIPIHQSA
ncbi:MAG: hypothetical protein WC089_00925 [Candidatus Paceibacterota bacterium]